MANLPVPAPRDFTVGETEVGSFLNSVRDALKFVLNAPLATLYQGAAQSIPGNAFTAITFDSTTLDSYGGHSNVTNNSRYTAQVAGWYSVSGAAGWVNNTTGARGLEVMVNGASINGGSAIAAPSPGLSVTVTAVGAVEVFLAAGSYVELWAYQNSGGALNTNGGGAFCSYMTVEWKHT